MARGHAFWMILVGGVPTAFRADDRDSLVPTLHQLQRKQADVTLRWFDRGRLWNSPAEARDSLTMERRRPDKRGRDWRPGGEHKDPRDKYKITRDEKRARFKKNLGRPTHDWKPAPSSSSAPPASAPRDESPERPREPRPLNWKPASTGRGPREERERRAPAGPINWKPARETPGRSSSRPSSSARGPIDWKPASDKPAGAGQRGWKPKPGGAGGRWKSKPGPGGGWKPKPGAAGGSSHGTRGWKPAPGSKPKGSGTARPINWKPAPAGGKRPIRPRGPRKPQ